MLAKLVEGLFVLLLFTVVPALSHLTARRLEHLRIPRLDLYLSAVISQWLLAALAALVVLASRSDFRAWGFREVPTTAFAGWTLFLAFCALAALGMVVLLERLGWMPDEPDLVRLLMPETRREKVLAVVMLAPTAALCEEFVYRGYLLVQLSQWSGAVGLGWVGSSVAFGLAHAYQGWSGMVRAAVLGAFLAYPVVRLGSLYPSMAAHFLIDAVALAWLGPQFLEPKREI